MRLHQTIGWATASLLLATAASADWIRVARATGGAIWSVDPARIRRSGGKTQVWAQIDFSADRSVRYRRTVELLRFDCEALTYKTLSWVDYDSLGKVVSGRTAPDYGFAVGYEPVVPDSVVETVYQAACPSEAPSP